MLMIVMLWVAHALSLIPLPRIGRSFFITQRAGVPTMLFNDTSHQGYLNLKAYLERCFLQELEDEDSTNQSSASS